MEPILKYLREVALNQAEWTKRIHAGYTISVVEATHTHKKNLSKNQRLCEISISLSVKNAKKPIFLKDIADARRMSKVFNLASNMKLQTVMRKRTWN